MNEAAKVRLLAQISAQSSKDNDAETARHIEEEERTARSATEGQQWAEEKATIQELRALDKCRDLRAKQADAYERARSATSNTERNLAVDSSARYGTQILFMEHGIHRKAREAGWDGRLFMDAALKVYDELGDPEATGSTGR